MSVIKAIETRYKGYRFRSRLEARWAVFFDNLGIPWEYEKEGYIITDKQIEGRTWPYLPDFFLPVLGCHVEVKGTLEGLSPEYFEIISWAIDHGGGLPGVSDSYGTTRGLLWLGPIPPETKYNELPNHIFLQHHKGGWCRTAHFDSRKGLIVNNQLNEYFDASWGDASDLKNQIQKWVYSSICRVWPHYDFKVANAYMYARMARFEHGERG